MDIHLSQYMSKTNGFPLPLTVVVSNRREHCVH